MRDPQEPLRLPQPTSSPLLATERPGGLGLRRGLAGTKFPEIGADNRSITIEYAEPYADWEVAFDVGLPAHVVAAKSGLTDEEDLVELLKDTPRGNPEKPASHPALKKISDFWNTGFDTKALPDDPALYLSSGPYIVRDIVPEVS